MKSTIKCKCLFCGSSLEFTIPNGTNPAEAAKFAVCPVTPLPGEDYGADWTQPQTVRRDMVCMLSRFALTDGYEVASIVEVMAGRMVGKFKVTFKKVGVQ